MSRKNTVAKIASVAVALGMVLTVFAAPVQTQAQTEAELQAQIDQLLATIAALQAQIQGDATASGFACPVGGFNSNFTVGSNGTEVLDLQVFLNSVPGVQVASVGAGSPGNETSYFGPATRGAVVQFQEKYASEVLAPVGLSAGTGYWGPSSRAKANALCAPSPTPGDDDDDMDDDDDDDDFGDGDEGSMTVTRGSASSAVVDLGDEEDIYSVEIEANDSDMKIERLDVEFNKRPWLYIDELVLTVDGEEIASDDDLDEATEVTSTEWRVRFTDLDLLVEEDEEVEVVVWAITPSSLPGSRESETVTVLVPDDGVRGIDEAGLIHYEPSGDLDSRSFTFDDNFGLGDLEMKSNDDSPESGIIVVSSTTETNGVEVMLFDVEADDGSATLEEIYVEATTTTANADDIIAELCLFDGSTELECSTLTEATASVSNRGVATGIVAGEYYALFDDLEYELDADEEVNLRVEASLNEADGTNYSAGDTIDLEMRAIGGYNADFEDTTDTGTLESSEVFTLLTEGIFIEGVSTDASVESAEFSGDEEKGTYQIVFDVTAVEEDAWIHKNSSASATSGVEYEITGGTPGGTTTASLSCSGCTTSGSTFFKVSEGETEQFTLTVSVNPATTGFYALELEEVYFDDDTSLGTADTAVTVPDTSDFETGEVEVEA